MSPHWSYDLVKDIALKDKNIEENLEDLKSMLRDDIGSTRNMCRIKTIDELLDCLERHDSLSEYNIEPLREIADQCGSKELERAVSEYSPPKDTTPFNDYREQRLADDIKMRLNINGPQTSDQRCNDVINNCNGGYQNMQSPPAVTPYPQQLTDKKRAAIYKTIAQEIGRYWRSLGRELGIRQGQLDAIEMQYPRDLQAAVSKMLELFEEDESQDPKQHVLILCRALEECRRKDLRRKVENIMSH